MATIDQDKDGRWRIAGVAMADGRKISNIVEKAALEKTAAKRAAQIDRLTYIDCPMYSMTFAYLNSDGQEYLVPYGVSSDIRGLADGKIYTAAETMDVLYEHFGDSRSTGDANTGAYDFGLPGLPEPDGPSPWIGGRCLRAGLSGRSWPAGFVRRLNQKVLPLQGGLFYNQMFGRLGFGSSWQDMLVPVPSALLGHYAAVQL